MEDSVVLKSVQFSGWYNEFLKQSADIVLVSDQVELLRRRVESNGDVDSRFDIVFANIMHLLSCWVDRTYVGVRKPKTFQSAFQRFFCSLYELLLSMRLSDVSNMIRFADSALFHGTVYRYLGYSSGNRKHGKVRPVFNDIYVSWTKNERVPYLESKLYGTVTHLTCEIRGDDYGIDLGAFDISKDFEAEVVFPTIKRCVTNIVYLKE